MNQITPICQCKTSIGCHTVHGDVKEVLPKDALEPLGGCVTIVTCKDANLFHCDLVTGRSVKGVPHLPNETPIDWCSKKQVTVETTAHGSEFVFAHTAAEQIVDLRNVLRCLGAPVLDGTLMFGNNKSIIDSAAALHAKLHKRHTAPSFHSA